MIQKIILSMLVFWCTLCFAAPPWSAIGKYYGGMSKAQAQKVGLTNCVPEDHFTVACKASAPVELAGISSYESRITLDARTGVVQSLSFRFDVSSEARLLAFMDNQYGEGKWGDLSTCRKRSWDRDDDNVVSFAACKDESRYLKLSGFGVYVKSNYSNGRAAYNQKYAAIAKKEKEKREQRAKSFESK
jgi:hypothetical protein